MTLGRRRLVVSVLCTMMLMASGLAACGGDGASTQPSGMPSSGAPTSGSSSTSLEPSPSTSTTTPQCAQRTLDQLSLAERVGQLFMGGIQVDRSPAVVPSALGEAHVGALLLYGTSTGGSNAAATAIGRGREVAGSPAGVRPIVAVDQEGGLVQHLKGPGFTPMPSAQEQGEMTPARLRRETRSWAAELRSVGVNLNLAPVADVVPASIGTANQPIGALDRGYGSDPSSVGEHVAAFVAGMGEGTVATTVKHFPGLGKVVGNTDVASGVADTRTTRDDPDLAAFGAGLDAGAHFLMVALATYEKIDPNHRAVFSSTVIDGMIRHDLGFDGVAISDDLGAAKEVSAVPPAQRALDFLGAGGDMVIVTGPPSVLLTMTQAVITAARSNEGFRSAIDRHALRILTAKERMGLLTCSSTR